ncbi:MAG: hypothetical protein JJ896_12525 [Rhodothermales bacterium]|nr:hypothetical protein [Rhodothermales bacterium]MBO6780471.1 hypothetical protein [Rhodothermales bacterium]
MPVFSLGGHSLRSAGAHASVSAKRGVAHPARSRKSDSNRDSVQISAKGRLKSRKAQSAQAAPQQPASEKASRLRSSESRSHNKAEHQGAGRSSSARGRRDEVSDRSGSARGRRNEAADRSGSARGQRNEAADRWGSARDQRNEAADAREGVRSRARKGWRTRRAGEIAERDGREQGRVRGEDAAERLAARRKYRNRVEAENRAAEVERRHASRRTGSERQDRAMAEARLLEKRDAELQRYSGVRYGQATKAGAPSRTAGAPARETDDQTIGAPARETDDQTAGAPARETKGESRISDPGSAAPETGEAPESRSSGPAPEEAEERVIPTVVRTRRARTSSSRTSSARPAAPKYTPPAASSARDVSYYVGEATMRNGEMVRVTADAPRDGLASLGDRARQTASPSTPGRLSTESAKAGAPSHGPAGMGTLMAAFPIGQTGPLPGATIPGSNEAFSTGPARSGTRFSGSF